MKTTQLLVLFAISAFSALASGRDLVPAVVLTEGLSLSSQVNGPPTTHGFARGSLVEILRMDQDNPQWVKIRVDGKEGYMPRADLTSVKKYRKYVGEPFAPVKSPSSPEYYEYPGPNSPANAINNYIIANNIPLPPNTQIHSPQYIPPADIPTVLLPAPGIETAAVPAPSGVCGTSAVEVSGTAVVRATSLNLRERPTTDSGSLGTFTNGSTGNAVCSRPPWTLVEFENSRGWMHNDYLVLPETAIVNAPQQIAAETPAALALAPQPAETPALEAIQTAATPAYVPPAFVAKDHCIDSLIPKTVEDQRFIEELESTLGVSDLNNSVWSDNQIDTAFRIGQHRDSMTVTVTNLPERARNEIADGLSANPAIGFFSFLGAVNPRQEVDKAITNGNVRFEVTQLCIRNGQYSVALEGVDKADKKGGILYFTPNQNSFTMSGALGDTPTSSNPRPAPMIQLNSNSFSKVNFN